MRFRVEAKWIYLNIFFPYVVSTFIFLRFNLVLVFGVTNAL